MNWFKISVETTHEAVEAVSNLLIEQGAQGVEIEDAFELDHYDPDAFGEVTGGKKYTELTGTQALVNAYFPETALLPEITSQLKLHLAQFSSYGFSGMHQLLETTAINEEDWNTSWKKYYHPVRLTRFVTVVPDWEDYAPETRDELVIRLDPGMAFGTGTHPTTRLMIQALELVLRGGETVFDIGTGSGILAIAARLLGAANVEAFDIDEVAVRQAKENLARNPAVDEVVIAQGAGFETVRGTADVIVANILAEIIVPLLPEMREHLNPDGRILLSGIIDSKVPALEEAISSAGLAVEEHLSWLDWNGFLLKEKEA